MKTDVPNRIIEQTHICEKCCAEFFTWIQLNEHHKACNEDKLVLIVKNNNGMPVHQELYTISSPVPSTEYSDMSAESTDGGFELRHMFVNDDIVDRFDEGPDLEEVMELERCPMESQPLNCSRLPESSSLLMSSAGMPTTNVTLEILHSTRVAVAQFSQGLNSWGIGGKAVSAAIPVILEHLLALQQQQVHQLHLIDQICSQVTVIKKHSPQPGIPPVSSSISDIPNPFPTQEGISPSVLRQSGLMSLFINEQAVPSLSSVPEKSQRSPVQIISKETCRAVTHPTLSSENIDPLLTGSSSSSSSNTNSQINSIGCTETLSTSSPASMEQSRFLSSSSRLAFLPQRSPSNDIIFPNPQANITSTANTLNPHATLIKHRKGKLPNITSFKAKLSPEESLFKHKCRFCTKVFGSDSALQIHLRSHTGERPFKCNICGNRFSTKGNLKVHFQRHKDKYPHVQMNPCPVPEYLNNIPTNSEIPYGMPVTSKKNVFSWLDNKPVVATLPATICLPHNTTSSNIGGSNDSDGVAIPIKSLCHLAPFSPIQRRSDAASVSPQSSQETEASDIDKKEDIVKAPVISSTSSLAIAAVPFTSLSPVSCSSLHSLMSDEFKQPADSMQTSETLKLQQLVENIHKKMTDPNQCILCHRVLSCQSALKMHYRIHTGKRTHKCKVCGRAFITKGNLKAHFGIHRENPFNVQHPCTNCQKKFTSAVALQQHIHMPMLSQIPDSTLVDGFQEIDISVSVTARNVDSLCSNHKNIDGISMNDEEEDEELKDMEEGINPFKPLIPICNCPKFSTNISSMAALENQNSVGMILMPNKASNVKSPTTGFYDSSQINTKCDLSEKKRVNCYEIITNLSEFYSSPSASVSHIQRNSESMMARSADTSNGPDSSEHLMASVKKKQSESVTSSSAAAMSQFVAGMQARMLGVKEKALYSTLFQQSREQGTIVMCSFSSYFSMLAKKLTFCFFQ